jgi:hypothetical protein
LTSAPAGSDEQLAAVASLGAALDGSGIEYWLFGGWAVDFWVGAVTRPHADVDVAAWRRDYDAILAALEPAGFRHAPKDKDGAVVIPFPDAPDAAKDRADFEALAPARMSQTAGGDSA